MFSALADKDVAAMLSLLATVCPTIVATTSSNERSLPAELRSRITGGAASRPIRTRRWRPRGRSPGRRGAVVVCGSLYLLHDLAT